MRKLFPLALLCAFVLASASTALPQDSRAKAEPLIRTAVYECTLAALTGDVKLYRSYIAHRTMELNRLVYEGFKEVPQYAEMIAQNNLDTADKFFDTMFTQGASNWANVSQDEKEQRARARLTPLATASQI